MSIGRCKTNQTKRIADTIRNSNSTTDALYICGERVRRVKEHLPCGASLSLRDCDHVGADRSAWRWNQGAFSRGGRSQRVSATAGRRDGCRCVAKTNANSHDLRTCRAQLPGTCVGCFRWLGSVLTCEDAARRTEIADKKAPAMSAEQDDAKRRRAEEEDANAGGKATDGDDVVQDLVLDSARVLLLLDHSVVEQVG
eukprot:373801-Rhodomonas_salina.2